MTFFCFFQIQILSWRKRFGSYGASCPAYLLFQSWKVGVYDVASGVGVLNGTSCWTRQQACTINCYDKNVCLFFLLAFHLYVINRLITHKI